MQSVSTLGQSLPYYLLTITSTLLKVLLIASLGDNNNNNNIILNTYKPSYGYNNGMDKNESINDALDGFTVSFFCFSWKKSDKTFDSILKRL